MAEMRALVIVSAEQMLNDSNDHFSIASTELVKYKAQLKVCDRESKLTLDVL